jgi:hypothetical protein
MQRASSSGATLANISGRTIEALIAQFACWRGGF